MTSLRLQESQLPQFSLVIITLSVIKEIEGFNRVISCPSFHCTFYCLCHPATRKSAALVWAAVTGGVPQLYRCLELGAFHFA